MAYIYQMRFQSESSIPDGTVTQLNNKLEEQKDELSEMLSEAAHEGCFDWAYFDSSSWKFTDKAAVFTIELEQPLNNGMMDMYIMEQAESAISAIAEEQDVILDFTGSELYRVNTPEKKDTLYTYKASLPLSKPIADIEAVNASLMEYAYGTTESFKEDLYEDAILDDVETLNSLYLQVSEHSLDCILEVSEPLTDFEFIQMASWMYDSADDFMIYELAQEHNLSYELKLPIAFTLVPDGADASLTDKDLSDLSAGNSLKLTDDDLSDLNGAEDGLSV